MAASPVKFLTEADKPACPTELMASPEELPPEASDAASHVLLNPEADSAVAHVLLTLRLMVRPPTSCS